MEITLTIIFALWLDRRWGEPRRFHPLVGFGNLVSFAEKRLYADSRWRGAWLCALLLALVVALLWFVFYGLNLGLTNIADAYLDQNSAAWLALGISGLFSAALLYLAIAWRSLDEHASDVSRALHKQDIALARAQAGKILSRDTRTLDASGVAGATSESVLENGNDAIFGAIFWYCLAGIPGALCYRLVNTLDAMWGYKSVRYLRFGWAAARLDDAMNFVPARLAALSYALAGNLSQGLRCWTRQAKHWKSTNAGAVMAAGAGSLGVSLGGAAIYHGERQDRPSLGQGLAANEKDIDRAVALIRRSILIWVALIASGECFVYVAN